LGGGELHVLSIVSVAACSPAQVIKLISQVIADFADGEISQVRF